MEDIIQTLTNRYGTKHCLVVECKDELASISPPDPGKAAAAADYVTTALTKIQAIMHVMEQEGLADQLLAYRLEEPILRTMAKHPRLQVYEARFGQLYGDETRRSGLVDSRKMYDLLVTCLTQAESDLLYVRTTQNYDSPARKPQGSSSGSSSGSGGGGKKDNKKNKTNGKQINQTAGSKKQQGNGGNGSNGGSNSGPPKQQRKCPYCASTVSSHGHVLEC